jgi:hypothetical protein
VSKEALWKRKQRSRQNEENEKGMKWENKIKYGQRHSEKDRKR